MLLKAFSFLFLLFVFVQSQEDIDYGSQDPPSCTDTCHANAECLRFSDGKYCCNCTAGFFGDGVNCYEDVTQVVVRGKIRGKVNDIALDDTHFVGNVQYLSDESNSHLSFQNEELAELQPLLFNVFTPIFWMFSGVESRLSKTPLTGYALTGGTFTRIAHLRFFNSDREEVGNLYIQQNYAPVPGALFLINVETEVDGQLPKLEKDDVIAFPDFQQEYVVRSNKDSNNHLIESGGEIKYRKSSADYNSVKQYFTIQYSDRINFTTCASLNSFEGVSDIIVKLKEFTSLYDHNEKYVRFYTKQWAYPIDEAADACDVADCDTLAYCSLDGLDLENPSCTCKTGYTGDGKECVDINECEQNQCIPNAACGNLQGSFYCKCIPPYVGDGVQECKLEEKPIDICSSCHANAICVRDENLELTCRCQNGFQGDGFICEPVYVPEVQPDDKPNDNEYDCSAGCDVNAECVRHENKAGLCCVCNENYIGNGKYCFYAGSSIVISGKVNGIVNGEKLSNVDLHCSVLTFETDTRNHASLTLIPSRLSASFQTLMQFFTTINWLFAGPHKSGIVSSNEPHRIAVNGFTLTGGNLTRTVTITFNDVTPKQNGDDAIVSSQVVIKQDFNGLWKDLNNYRIDVNTNIDGEIPLLDPHVKVHFRNFKQVYKHVRRGLVESTGVLSYETVTGDLSEGSYTNQLFYSDRIEFNECSYERDYSDEVRVNSKGTSVLHLENAVRFSSLNFVYPNEAQDDPCELNTCSVYAECTPNEYNKDIPNCECKPGFEGDGYSCFDIDECAQDKPPCDENAVCYNLLGHYDCKCKAPYQGSGKECVYEGSCAMCSNNAYCEEGDIGKKCICNTGYTGNGFQCVKIESPDALCSSCSPHAECLFNKQTRSYQCSCKDGFLGDGSNCEPLPCNEHFNCGTHANCDMTSTGRYECRCSNGYFGDGYKCSSESCEILNNCGENARCLIDSVTQMHHCVCIPGYAGNGYKCVVDSQPCNRFNNCHQHAECILDEHQAHHKCTCKPGYYGDGYKCTAQNSCVNDPNVCDVNALCVFESKIGEHVCKCRYGYEGDGLHRRCYPIGEGPVGLSLVYAQGVSLHKISLDKNEQESIQPYKNRIVYIPHQTAVAVDFDCHEQDVYWSDVTGKIINKVKADGSKYELILEDLQSPEGLAIDWISRNMFITDSKAKTIEIANLKGTYRKVIVKTNLHNPRGIAVDPFDGYIFWTDWYRKSPKIERANMDGTHRVVLVKDNIGIPNGLYYDHRRKEVCWADAKTKRIECIGRDGTGRRNVTQISLMHPFDIAEVGQTIYWSDWSRKEIPTVSKSGHPDRSGESLKLAPGGHGRVYGLSIVKHSCPIGTNECTFENGGCEYLCVPLTNNDRQCICPDNVSPSECIKKKN